MQVERRRNARKRQRQGKQDIRYLSLLVFLALCLILVLELWIQSQINPLPNAFQTRFLYICIGTWLYWCISLRLLWKYQRSGKWLYILGIVGSCYLYRESIQIFTYEAITMQLRLIFGSLWIIKCGVLFYGALRLICSRNIQSIWNIEELLDDPFQDEQEQAMVEEQLPVLSQLEQQGKRCLKKRAIRLGICLYMSVLAIILLLTFVGNEFPSAKESIQIIQYPLFSSCLFSILIWSVPMIGMYLGKPWSPYLLLFSCIGELLHGFFSFSTYSLLFTNVYLPTEYKLYYSLIELSRYFLLYLASRHTFSEPILYAYRKKSTNKA